MTLKHINRGRGDSDGSLYRLDLLEYWSEEPTKQDHCIKISTSEFIEDKCRSVADKEFCLQKAASWSNEEGREGEEGDGREECN